MLMALMKVMSTSLIPSEVTRHGNLKCTSLTTILQADIGNWCFGRWLNRWLFACDGKRRPNWISIHASYSKIEGLSSISRQQRLTYPIYQGFIRYGSAALSLPSTKEEPFGRSAFLWRTFRGASSTYFSLFDDPVALEKEEKLQQTIDRIQGPIWLYLSSEGSSLLKTHAPLHTVN